MSKAAELDGCWSIERSDSLTISLDFEHDEQMAPAMNFLRSIIKRKGANEETGKQMTDILCVINQADIPKLIKASQEVEGD